MNISRFQLSDILVFIAGITRSSKRHIRWSNHRFIFNIITPRYCIANNKKAWTLTIWFVFPRFSLLNQLFRGNLMFCYNTLNKFYRTSETIFLLHDGSYSLRLLGHCRCIENSSDGTGKLLGGDRSPV